MATLEQVREFRHAGDKLGVLAAREIASIWAALDFTDPVKASKDLQVVLPDLVNDYGDMSAALSADFFDEVTADYDLPNRSAILAPLPAAGQTKAVTRWGLGPIFGVEQSFVGALALIQEGMHRLILQPGRDTIDLNTKRTKLTYARVPGSGEPCAFCLVLASRGAVYGSERDALYSKHGSKYHTKCRCTPVPMRSDADLPGGYDLARYQATYEKNASGSLEETLASIRGTTNAR